VSKTSISRATASVRRGRFGRVGRHGEHYGPAEVVRDSLLADRDADVDALIVMPIAETTEVRIGQLRPVARLTKEERMP
jgi:hypothetical protein